MRAKALLLAMIFLLLISFQNALADEWWNESWHFRIPIDVNSSVQRENVSVTVHMNFTEILEDNNVTGTFDSNSIRVLEGNYSVPYDWENSTLDTGNITWIANGTIGNFNRRFWIYFDVIENGQKPKGKLMKDVPHWRSGYENNMNVWSNQTTSPGIGYSWNRTWAKSLEVYWKWSTETGYDYSYLYVNGNKVREKTGTGEETAFFTGSEIVARFASDESTIESTTDSYGTYGTAVDWIKFYPVSNFTEAPTNKTVGRLDKQNLRINLIKPEENSTQYYGDNITIEVNITDIFGSPMENASVNFMLIYNSTLSYICEGSSEGNGYYNCSWNTVGKELGNYSVMVNVSKEYYGSNSTTWNNRFILDKRSFRIQLLEPEENSTHYRGEQILLRANITDQDGNPVQGASVNFTVKYNDTLYYNLIGNDENNGYYNATWNSSEKELGNYSVIVNVSKQYFYSNTTSWEDRFHLETGPPIITINIQPKKSDQFSSIIINATVEDQSGWGIDWVRINITQPNGFVQNDNMTNVSSYWVYNYTNTSQRGDYHIVVYAKDNHGKIGSSEGNFTIFVKLNITLKTQMKIYYKGESGRIEYILRDAAGNKLADANVNIRLKNPNGTIIWPEDWPKNYTTNENGTIVPPPTFLFTSDDPEGNYTLLSTTYFFDNISNVTVTKDTEYIIQLYKNPGQLLLDLEAPTEVSTTEKLIVSASVTDGIRSIDPDWINASLYDPSNSMVCLENVNGVCNYNVEMIRREQGVYYREFSSNTTMLEGSWRWKVTVGKESSTITKEIFTKLVGGPFDLRNITILDNGVPDLRISVITENTGDNGRDVTLVWNLTRTDNGDSLDSGAETFYVPAKSEKPYTIEPHTNYIGEAKITMVLYYGTERAGAYRIFTTQKEVTTTTVPPSRRGPTGAAVSEEKIPKIEIISYPEEVEIEKGWSGYAVLGVNNTGDVDLHDVEVLIEGIDESWIKLPKSVSILPKGSSTNFTIKFEIPEKAKSGNYEGNFTVKSKETIDKKHFVLRVFETEKERLFYEIQTLNSRIEKLENEIVKAEKDNKDVRSAKEILGDAQGNLRIAEEYLDAGLYEKAKEKIRVTKDLLDQAEMEIKTAKKYLIPFFGPMAIQYQLMILTAILLLALGLIIYIVRKVKHLSPKKIPGAQEFKRLITPKKDVRKLEEEKEKIEKTLKLLEEEYKEGLISEESYKELKENNENKLRKIVEEINEVSK
ncbi:MAG: hypothetical protein J7L45_02245 [Candidatus Aenigmarchaeota archaeon]|nr:hypothetical protein [Candidatus Aenigmarchaeota archaeon]